MGSLCRHDFSRIQKSCFIGITKMGQVVRHIRFKPASRLGLAVTTKHPYCCCFFVANTPFNNRLRFGLALLFMLLLMPLTSSLRVGKVAFRVLIFAGQLFYVTGLLGVFSAGL